MNRQSFMALAISLGLALSSAPVYAGNSLADNSSGLVSKYANTKLDNYKTKTKSKKKQSDTAKKGKQAAEDLLNGADSNISAPGVGQYSLPGMSPGKLEMPKVTAPTLSDDSSSLFSYDSSDSSKKSKKKSSKKNSKKSSKKSSGKTDNNGVDQSALKSNLLAPSGLSSALSFDVDANELFSGAISGDYSQKLSSLAGETFEKEVDMDMKFDVSGLNLSESFDMGLTNMQFDSMEEVLNSGSFDSTSFASGMSNGSLASSFSESYGGVLENMQSGVSLSDEFDSAQMLESSLSGLTSSFSNEMKDVNYQAMKSSMSVGNVFKNAQTLSGTALNNEKEKIKNDDSSMFDAISSTNKLALQTSSVANSNKAAKDVQKAKKTGKTSSKKSSKTKTKKTKTSSSKTKKSSKKTSKKK